MAKGSTFRILHVASFIGNIGDNASHCGFYSILKDALGLDFTVERIEIRKFYKNYRGPDRGYFDLDFVRKANRFDLLVIGGGGFLDYWLPDSATGTTIDIDPPTLDALRVPLLITSIGCYPHKKVPDDNVRRLEQFLDRISDRARSTIAFRNDGSLENIRREYGGKYDGIFPEILDNGFFFEPKLKGSLLNGRDYIAINMSDDQLDMLSAEHGVIEKAIYYDQISSLVKTLCDRYAKHIVLIPHIHNDLKAIHHILERQDDFLTRKNISVAPCIQGVEGANLAFSIYRESALVIASRFHANVCSLALNAKTIGIAALDRVSHLYQSLNMKDSVVQPTPEFQQTIIEKIEQYESGGLSVNTAMIDGMKGETIYFYRDFLSKII